MPVLDKDLDVIIKDEGGCLKCGDGVPSPGSLYCLNCGLHPPLAPSDDMHKSDLARKELAARELARRRLLPFIKRLRPEYQAGWFHIDLAARLERFAKRCEAGKSPRMAISVPPRHGKSEQASKAFVAWYLGRNPNSGVIAATHSDKLAIDNSRDVLDYVRDPAYRVLFPDLELSREAKSASGWRTTQGGAYKPVGVGAGIAGYGANVLIIDDPHRDKDAYSPTVRANIWRWYKSSARTRLMPGGGQLLIATRWTFDDLIGSVLEEEGDIIDGGEWEVVRYACQAEEDEYRLPNGIVVNYPAEGATQLRLKGEYLHPERWSQTEMEKHKTDPLVWSALYQQEPISGETALFHRDMFKLGKVSDAPKNVTKYTACDLAVSMSQRSDFTVMLTVGVDQDDHIWILDLVREHFDPLEIVEQILDLYELHTPEVIGIEKNQVEMSIRPFLQKRIDERRMPNVNVISLDHGNKDKVARSAPIQARIRQGRVHVPTDVPWFEDFMRELEQFPAGRKDDQVDALAWIGQMLDDMMKAKAKKERDTGKKSWRDKLNKHRKGSKSWLAA